MPHGTHYQTLASGAPSVCSHLFSLCCLASPCSSCSEYSTSFCPCRRVVQESRCSLPDPTLRDSSSNILHRAPHSCIVIGLCYLTSQWKYTGQYLNHLCLFKKWFTFSLNFINKKNSPVQKEHWITYRQMSVSYLVLKQHYIWTIQ